MFRRIIAAGFAIAALTAAASAHAACSSLPYTLANGATADAGQVMTDLNCLLVSPAFTGPVGIGTTSLNPSTTLDVRSSSTAGVPVALFGYGQAGVALEQNWPGFYFNNYYINGNNYFMGAGYAGLLNLNAQTGDFYIQTSSAAGSTGGVVPFNPIALYIKNNGNVGIGNTSPNNSLDVQGSATGGNGNLCVHNSATNAGICLESYNSNASAGGLGIIQSINNSGSGPQPLTVNPFGGNVGIGASNPSYTLDVNGSIRSSGSLYTNNVFGSNPGGTTLCYSGSGPYMIQNCSSDRRLKDNIIALDGDALAVIGKLRPVHFTWKKDSTGMVDVGFIAQDVEPLIPSAVRHPPNDKGYMSLELRPILAYTVKAVQELSTENDNQKSQIEIQKGQIDKQNEEIGELKSEVADLKKVVAALQAAH